MNEAAELVIYLDTSAKLQCHPWNARLQEGSPRCVLDVVFDMPLHFVGQFSLLGNRVFGHDKNGVSKKKNMQS